MPGNAAIVRRGYEAFKRGDLKALTELFGDDASWHTPGGSPLAGDAVGRDAVFARLGRYMTETGGTFRADLMRVLTDEDGREHFYNLPARGTRSGRSTDNTNVARMVVDDLNVAATVLTGRA